MTIEFASYTNADLVAVDPTTLGTVDLQDFREEMQDRGLSTTPPALVPVTPPPAPTALELQSPGAIGYHLGVEDDGSLRTTREDDSSYQRIAVVIPAGIADGQSLAYSAASARMVAANAGGELLLADSTGELLTDETGYSVLTEG